MSAAPWTAFENECIVADYFAMLADELADRPYVKAWHNRQLQGRIHRSGKSIEYKHRNISAVLLSAGEPWINGYKPLFNFQDALRSTVLRRLPVDHDLESRSTLGPPELVIKPPPTHWNEPPSRHLDAARKMAQKVDFVALAARNRQLGRAGEERVLVHERAVLNRLGRDDLARRVRWVSEEDGDGAGYDIASYSPEGHQRLIEVKTTNGWEWTPFHITRNECAVAREQPGEWRLLRLWNFVRQPQAFELCPPLENHVTLVATGFEAHFR